MFLLSYWPSKEKVAGLIYPVLNHRLTLTNNHKTLQRPSIVEKNPSFASSPFKRTEYPHIFYKQHEPISSFHALSQLHIQRRHESETSTSLIWTSIFPQKRRYFDGDGHRHTFGVARRGDLRGDLRGAHYVSYACSKHAVWTQKRFYLGSYCSKFCWREAFAVWAIFEGGGNWIVQVLASRVVGSLRGCFIRVQDHMNHILSIWIY